MDELNVELFQTEFIISILCSFSIFSKVILKLEFNRYLTREKFLIFINLHFLLFGY